MNLDLEFKEKKCVICKKGIIAGQDWVYKTGSSHNLQYFCSWHCLRDYEKNWSKKKGSKVSRREKIIEAIQTGKDAKTIANELHVDRTNVIYWQRKLGVL